jgi:hypothetical protein
MGDCLIVIVRTPTSRGTKQSQEHYEIASPINRGRNDGLSG